ncbi:MAG: site-specific DNA-methyltransferase [Candidatus Cloacimonetes bacterium]|nr:site-specific DNA-methyltransferase [Candidatus Cloacimonadota bacterium]
MSNKNKLKEKDIEFIYKKLQNGEEIPDKYRFKIPFETQKEYELTYDGKERPEDIIDNVISVPFQPIKKFGKIKEEEWNNKLIFGDNLQALKYLLKLKSEGKLKNSDGRRGVKLVYIDPPFATKQDFKGSKGQKAYQDKIAGAEFLEFLRKRIVLLKELLTEDGSIYVHLDWKKADYVRIILDEVFSEHRFRNELIWYYGERQLPSATKYNSKHEVIFFYSKSNEYIFNMQFKKHSKEYIKNFFKYIDEKERRFRTREISNTYPLGRQYLDETPGIAMDTVWDDIPAIHSAKAKHEQTGFPTQKPEKLLERIIKTSSNSRDIVLDAFAGSGTTGVVAEKLNRKWIMIDSSKLAIYTMQKRILNLREDIGNKGRNLKPKTFVIYNAGLYKDSGFLEQMDKKDYKKFLMELFQVYLKKHKINGLEMDGILNSKSVMIFSQNNYLTEDFVNELHKTVGSAIKNEMYIIVPQSVVRFNQDYIDKGDKRYIILRVPYSIIQAIQEKNYKRAKQPVSKEEINRTIESVGFDFIYPLKVKCDYYIRKEKTLFDNYVIEIKEFEPIQISKNPLKFENPKEEALSMVMLDTDYDGEIFNIDNYFFGDEIKKNNYKISIQEENVGEKIMIIYLDILGNEKKEVKNKKDFMRE